MMKNLQLFAALMVVLGLTVPALAQELADDPQMIFQKTTVWRMLSPNATLDTCRQVGPIKITAKFSQGDDIYRERRSLFWKKMQIVRGCDPNRNVLVYLSYTDRLIEGSPQNSTSTVPVMPWGNEPAPKCGDFVNP